MPPMAKKKPRAGNTPVSFRLQNVLLDALDEYRHQFEFKPDRSAVIERALREFLEAKGVEVPDPPTDGD